MSLQDVFYLVSIVAMSLLTIIFIVLVVLVFYIRAKIGELIEILSHPGRIASNIGESLVDTAIDQVNRFTGGGNKKRTKRI